MNNSNNLDFENISKKISTLISKAYSCSGRKKVDELCAYFEDYVAVQFPNQAKFIRNAIKTEDERIADQLIVAFENIYKQENYQLISFLDLIDHKNFHGFSELSQQKIPCLNATLYCLVVFNRAEVIATLLQSIPSSLAYFKKIKIGDLPFEIRNYDGSVSLFDHAVSREKIETMKIFQQSGWEIEFYHLRVALENYADRSINYLLSEVKLTSPQVEELANRACQLGNIGVINKLMPENPLFYFKNVFDLLRNQQLYSLEEICNDIKLKVCLAYRFTRETQDVSTVCEIFLNKIKREFSELAPIFVETVANAQENSEICMRNVPFYVYQLDLREINYKYTEVLYHLVFLDEKAVEKSFLDKTHRHYIPMIIRAGIKTWLYGFNNFGDTQLILFPETLNFSGLDVHDSFQDLRPISSIKLSSISIQLKTAVEEKFSQLFSFDPIAILKQDMALAMAKHKFNNQIFEKFKHCRTIEELNIPIYLRDIDSIFPLPDDFKNEADSLSLRLILFAFANFRYQEAQQRLSKDYVKSTEEFFSARDANLLTPTFNNRYSSMVPFIEKINQRREIGENKFINFDTEGYHILCPELKISPPIINSVKFGNHRGWQILHGALKPWQTWKNCEMVFRTILNMDLTTIHTNPLLFYERVGHLSVLCGDTSPLSRGSGGFIECVFMYLHNYFKLKAPKLKQGFQLDCFDIIYDLDPNHTGKIFVYIFRLESFEPFIQEAVKKQYWNDIETRKLVEYYNLAEPLPFPAKITSHNSKIWIALCGVSAGAMVAMAWWFKSSSQPLSSRSTNTLGLMGLSAIVGYGLYRHRKTSKNQPPKQVNSTRLGASKK